jgi:uncharacterized membrane protein YgcG
MNHTISAIVAIIAVAALAAGLFATSIQAAHADSSETNFKFKQKLKNNCSGFSTCTNTAAETLAPGGSSGGGGGSSGGGGGSSGGGGGNATSSGG